MSVLKNHTHSSYSFWYLNAKCNGESYDYQTIEQNIFLETPSSIPQLKKNIHTHTHTHTNQITHLHVARIN